jgi:hypothetical protein
VQTLLSLHTVPFGFGVTVHADVPLHALVLHWSSVHVIVVPTHVPLWHESPYVHAFPSLHAFVLFV